MENDNKKKKNKKKKNKQAKNAELTAAAAAASVSADQISNGIDQNQQTNAFQAGHTPQPSADLVRHDVTASNASTEQIKQLQMEKDAYMKKEIDLELKFSKLHNEKEYWLQKEIVLEEKIKQLETAKEIWAQKEASVTETIAGLNADNTRLCSKVMELEESQKNLLQENQQLLKNISGLQSQMQNSANICSEVGKMENQHIKSEMLSAQTMVEKLLLENAELTAKLNAERDRNGIKAEFSSSDCSGPVADTTDPAHNAKHSAVVSVSESRTTERVLSIPLSENVALEPDTIPGTAEKLVEEVIADASSEKQPLLEEKTMPIEYEIEQIALKENDASGTNLPVDDSSSDETSLVPISDAPLIGAPFRFMSFMARYVTGADLVNQSA